MLSPLRNRFGIPGVISVIALVFAMLGGAYAASNNSGSGKASASAKRGKPGPPGKRGKPGPPGPAGPQGPAGPAGPAGAKGDNGAAGSNGAKGATGDKGTNGTAGAKGATGAAGATGATGLSGFTATLPSEATETGAWFMRGNADNEWTQNATSISFPIPLAEADVAGMETKIWKEGAEPAACPGSLVNPQADPGVLCVYISPASSVPTNPQILPPSFPEEFGVGTSGALLVWFTSLNNTKFASGSFAVTAP